MRATPWQKFTIIGLGTLVGPLDSAVNIAFPDITQSFGIEIQSIQWVVICYVLTYASLMLIFGRLGDLFGHLRIFQIGLAVSAIALGLCAAATEFSVFLTARVLQGVGTAMVISCGPALVTGLFEEHKRAQLLGAYTIVFGIGTAVGPSIGGLMVAAWGWPSVYWFRVPLALTALALTFILALPRNRRDNATFDTTGALLLCLSVAVLLLTLIQALPPGWRLGLAATTVCLFTIFIRWERTASAPILQIGHFRNIDLTTINLGNLAVNFTGFSIMLLTPYYLAKVLPLETAGLVLASGAAGMIAAAHIGGRLAASVNVNTLAVSAVLLTAAGVVSVGFWPPSIQSSTLQIAGMATCLLTAGAGMGLFQVACLEMTTASLPVEDRGVAGSLVMVTRTVGVIASASLLPVLFVWLQTADNDASFHTAFNGTFQYAAGALVTVLLLCLVGRRVIRGG